MNQYANLSNFETSTAIIEINCCDTDTIIESNADLTRVC